MDNNFDWERHNYLRSLTKELAMAAFQTGDITPAEYLNLQVPQKDAKTMDKALCAYRPKGTSPLDAIKHNDNRESSPTAVNCRFDEQEKGAIAKMYQEENEPPIGLIPKEHYERQKKASRFKDVCGAITRYYNASLPINIEWVEEYNEILKKIEPPDNQR